MKLLHVDSSILGPGSVSRQLSAEIVAAERQLHPGLEVVYRDLGQQPVGHLSGAHLAAAQGAVPEADALRQDVSSGQAALEEFLAADIVVVGAPMYNFAIPSQLKAWIDRLAVAGKTFRYTEKGAEGLAGGKKVIVASSRGGFYGPQTPIAFLDHQETYLRNIFGFFGITDVTFIRAEGLALGADQRAKSISAAQTSIAGLAA
ncbi:FMN-dependent NADH-azoreductase [Hyphomicrobium sp.]|uniref:FMN-dependent NADH-azoreductase n=1 Tax=Hyphomicrobium sp. TaxID=82 RepID=UPI000FB9847E|nr:FMN-dependent NADH-azoreductase [Hyphomicrobium sp.]MBN9247502.1 FMN-dependent NADH-azoreductase [Hyphomicrobium sp.]RUP09807.1 MAG: FMN-dependent NADH-azoreductase [Hyphomicrobium sp.]